MDLTLVSIVVGLGLTELLLTFYQLFRARRRVEWDALPLAWAALLLIVVVNYWWGIRAIMAQASGWTTGAGVRRCLQMWGDSLLASVSGGMLFGSSGGAQAAANTRSIKGFWEDPPAFNVLVCTDAGAEGVNLQTANVVVNYDLPWNPMVVEQRIGRVQRLASRHKYVVVFNLVVQHSVEEHVVARLLEKLQAISTTIGDIEGILERNRGQDRGQDTNKR